MKLVFTEPLMPNYLYRISCHSQIITCEKCINYSFELNIHVISIKKIFLYFIVNIVIINVIIQ